MVRASVGSFGRRGPVMACLVMMLIMLLSPPALAGCHSNGISCEVQWDDTVDHVLPDQLPGSNGVVGPIFAILATKTTTGTARLVVDDGEMTRDGVLVAHGGSGGHLKLDIQWTAAGVPPTEGVPYQVTPLTPTGSATWSDARARDGTMSGANMTAYVFFETTPTRLPSKVTLPFAMTHGEDAWSGIAPLVVASKGASIGSLTHWFLLMLAAAGVLGIGYAWGKRHG